MLCQSCNQRAATVHLTEVVSNAKKEIHLCEECAQAKGVAIKTKIEGLQIPEFFGHLAQSQAHVVADKSAEGQPRCATCGLTFEAFRNVGKFGCCDCFTSFKKGLMGLVDRIHGSTQHRGKVPNRATERTACQKELMELREELRVAVSEEAYERAAELRDRVHRLEGRLGACARETIEE